MCLLRMKHCTSQAIGAAPVCRFGLPPAHYNKWPALRDNFNLLTTSKDR